MTLWNVLHVASTITKSLSDKHGQASKCKIDLRLLKRSFLSELTYSMTMHIIKFFSELNGHVHDKDYILKGG